MTNENVQPNEVTPSFKRFGEGRPPWPQTIESLTHVRSFENALELGPAPGLRDARILAPVFKHLDLVDTEPSVSVAIAGLPEESRDKISFHNVPFDSYVFEPDKYDYVCAMNSLPFAGQNFDQVFHGMTTSLRPGGVFSGTVWTPRHQWRQTRPGIHAFRTEEEIRALLDNFHIDKMELVEGLRPAGGEQNVMWSSYKIIATKNLPPQPTS